MTKEAYIAGYVRSPFTFAFKGGLAGVRPDDLGAHVVRAILERTGVPGEEIEDVVWGCAFPEGEQGLNIGRVVGMLAGLPETVAGSTVNRWCGSSIQAVQVAAGMLKMNAGNAFIAGGSESMSRVPMMGFNVLPNTSWDKQAVDDYINVGLTAERVARECEVSRNEQDLFAYASHGKALAAQRDGRLAAEIVPFQSGAGSADRDGCVRETSLEKLGELKTVFSREGTVTAGSSSPMTDGATAVLVCDEVFLKRHGLTPLAHVGKLGRYASSVLAHVVAYTSANGEEIAADVDAVDTAMELGYSWREGPFKLADRVGAETIADALATVGEPVPVLLASALAQGGFYTDEGALPGFTSTSALQARRMGLLRPSDVIVMHRDSLLAAAKTKALALAENYQPPLKAQIPVAGPSGLLGLLAPVSANAQAGRISATDEAIAGVLASILTGGPNADPLRPASEENLMKLELNALLALVTAPTTRDRMDHMLKTGKPLRN